MNDKSHKFDKSEVVEALPAACGDETAAVEFFEQQRWGGSPVCPHCGGKDVYKLTSRDGGRNARFLWRCRGCDQQYTVRIGTVYEDSRLPLKHWCYGFWRACSSKKGVSALEIQRHCQISYKSALFLLHRVRFAMTDNNETPKKLTGTCEVDETFCGGKPRPNADGTKPKGTGYRKDSNKIPVVAMVERGGDVRAKVVPKVTSKNLHQFVSQHIDKSATVNTDTFPIYHGVLYDWARHDTVNHSTLEYSRTNPDGTKTHVNSCESFFSLIKRGLNGIYHAVSPEHLHRYVGEFEFRWNTRNLCDGDRIVRAIQSADGKRLVYSKKAE